jgi:hypothetical protein
LRVRLQAESAVGPAIRRSAVGRQQRIGRAERVGAEVTGGAAAIRTEQVAILLFRPEGLSRSRKRNGASGPAPDGACGGRPRRRRR